MDLQRPMASDPFAIFETGEPEQTPTDVGGGTPQDTEQDANKREGIGEWIAAVIGEKIDVEHLHESLKSGVVLCKLLAKIKPDLTVQYNEPESNGSLHPLMERENISMYLDSCWLLGLSSEDLFITSDLHANQNMKQVLKNLERVSIEAKAWGWTGPTLAEKQDRSSPQNSENGKAEQLQHMDSVTEIEELKQQLEETRKELARVNWDNEELQEKQDEQKIKFEEEIYYLEQKVTSLDDQLEVLMLENRGLLFENNRLRKSSDTEEQGESLRDSIRTLQSRLNELEKKDQDIIQNLREEVVKITESKYDIEDENLELHSEVKKYRNQFQFQKDLVKKKETMLVQQEKEAKSHIADLTKKHKEDLSSLQEKVDKLTHEKHLLKEKHNSVVQEVISLKEELKKVKEEVQELTKARTHLKAQLSKHNEDQHDIDQLNKELQTVHAQNQELNETKIKYEAKVSKLRGKLLNQKGNSEAKPPADKKKVLELTQKLEKLQLEHQLLQMTKEQLELQKNGLKEQIDKTSRSDSSLKAQLTQIQSEHESTVNSLKDQIQKLELDKAQFIEKQNEFDKSRLRNKSRQQKLTTQVEVLNITANEYKECIKSLNETLDQTKIDNAKLELSKKELEQAVSALTNELKLNQSKLSEVKKRTKHREELQRRETKQDLRQSTYFANLRKALEEEQLRHSAKQKQVEESIQNDTKLEEEKSKEDPKNEKQKEKHKEKSKDENLKSKSFEKLTKLEEKQEGPNEKEKPNEEKFKDDKQKEKQKEEKPKDEKQKDERNSKEEKSKDTKQKSNDDKPKEDKPKEEKAKDEKTKEEKPKEEKLKERDEKFKDDAYKSTPSEKLLKLEVESKEENLKSKEDTKEKVQAKEEKKRRHRVSKSSSTRKKKTSTYGKDATRRSSIHSRMETSHHKDDRRDKHLRRITHTTEKKEIYTTKGNKILATATEIMEPPESDLLDLRISSPTSIHKSASYSPSVKRANRDKDHKSPRTGEPHSPRKHEKIPRKVSKAEPLGTEIEIPAPEMKETKIEFKQAEISVDQVFSNKKPERSPRSDLKFNLKGEATKSETVKDDVKSPSPRGVDSTERERKWKTLVQRAPAFSTEQKRKAFEYKRAPSKLVKFEFEIAPNSFQFGGNSKQNLYIDETDVDMEHLQTLKKVVNSLLKSEPLENPNFTKLEQVFKKDSGRRVFTHLLQQSMLSLPEKVVYLNKTAFQQMLHLVTVALNEMHISKPADYISAKVLMELSYNLQWVAKEKKKKTITHVIKDYIKPHFIWQNLRFWEEYFWDKISQNFGEVKKLPKEQQQAFLANNLKEFAGKMLGWGNLPNESLLFFLGNMARQNDLTDTQTEEILEEINPHS